MAKPIQGNREELIRDLSRRVAADAPEWTDDSDRDPGVTLVQDIAADGRVLLRVDDWHESTMYGRVGSPAETNLSWLDFSRVADLSEDGRTVILGEGGRGGGARGSVYLRRTEGSSATRLENAFGPTACRGVWYCDACRQPFEAFKPV